MKELDIDISRHRSKVVDAFKDLSFDYVLTVCDNARESCPISLATANGFTMRSTIRSRYGLRGRPACSLSTCEG